MNRTGWSNAEFDQLVKEAKNEADEKKRFDLMYKAEKILFEEAPIIPIHFYNQVYLQNKSLTGICSSSSWVLRIKVR